VWGWVTHTAVVRNPPSIFGLVRSGPSLTQNSLFCQLLTTSPALQKASAKTVRCHALSKCLPKASTLPTHTSICICLEANTSTTRAS
jgi:hypothetical protein